jgi:hypothetical protein
MATKVLGVVLALTGGLVLRLGENNGSVPPSARNAHRRSQSALNDMRVAWGRRAFGMK